MDYLDPKKQIRHRRILFVGYILIAFAIATATSILVNQAYGFGLNKKGEVIQNGLVFISSQPNPADISLNGKLNKSKTNSRLLINSGIYNIELSRAGYYPWQRKIEINGGKVQKFDYPFLFPKQSTTNKVRDYNAAPTIATQSPDRRWVLVGLPDLFNDFDLFDQKNLVKEPTRLTVPISLLSAATGTQSWKIAEWADDNDHVLLQHLFDGKSEYILLNRVAPEQSVNLTSTLSNTSATITLIDKKYDKYYLFDSASGVLQSASLRNVTPVLLREHVFTFKSYGNDILLYATDSGAAAGKLLIKMSVADKLYTVRTVSSASKYLLELTKYNGTMYVAAGASSENRTYVYRDPVAQIDSQSKTLLPTPTQVLHVTAPDYISFSPNTQYIMIENGSQFSVYDVENKHGYNYTSSLVPDSPQMHANWMDGDRLMFVAAGKLLIFDFDYTNQRQIVVASSNYLPFFSPDYKFVSLLAPSISQGQFNFQQTSLLAPLVK